MRAVSANQIAGILHFQSRIQTCQPIISQMGRSLKKFPKMRRNGVKTGRIYIQLCMLIFIRQNISHPPKAFLSKTLYVELPQNLVICFKGTLASLLLDTTKTPHSFLLLLNLKQRISL